jgi:hypothetical protein
MHAKALLGMRYYVKTAHGLSKQFYKVTRQFLLFGTGQGSGALPAIWLTITCLLSALTALALLTVLHGPLAGYL